MEEQLKFLFFAWQKKNKIELFLNSTGIEKVMVQSPGLYR